MGMKLRNSGAKIRTMHFLSGEGRILKLVVSLSLMASCALAAGQSASNPFSDEITLQIIVVGSAEQAQQILNRLKKGESFLALAKENSIDSTAEDGGRMGNVSLSMLRPELRNAFQGLGAGQITQ